MGRALTAWFAMATLIVLLGFPKAGVYIAGVPVTLSYVLLGLAATARIFELAIRKELFHRSIKTQYIAIGIALFVLAGIELACFAVYGGKSLGITLSVIVSTILLPVLALLFGQWAVEKLTIDGVLKAFKWAIIPVFLFGIASFLIYNVSGKVIGIPYLTTTGNELELVAERHNLRGPVIKMFSTYNNGNILGINLLLWGPLLALVSVPAAGAYRLLCVLTLSRSVWAGLIAYEVLSAIIDRSYRRIFYAVIGAIVLALAVIGASMLIGRDPVKFLLDKDLGGRVTSLQQDLEVLSQRRIGWDSESVPAAAWLAFGPAGPLLIGMIWAAPIFLGGTTRVQKVARSVLAVYLIVGIVEGAFILIPTQAVYWFVASLALAKPERVRLRGEIIASAASSRRPVVLPLGRPSGSHVRLLGKRGLC